MTLSLEERLFRLWGRLDPNNKLDHGALFTELETRYSEEHRAYHTLAHLEHCFEEYDQVRRLFKNRHAAQFALCDHDFFYDTHAKDNELRSAKFARGLALQAGLDNDFGWLVYDHIMATAHDGVIKHDDSMYVVDIDLSIFGQPEDRFDQYEREIRFEYSHVPEDVFRKGRTAVLQRFLDRPTIYFTPHFQRKYEQQARSNLARSIKQLAQA